MASLKKCIEQHCKNCTYDQSVSGTWRDQVESCTVRSCALWPVRPMTVATINLNRKTRGTGADDVDIDALVAGLEDEEDEVSEPVA